GEGVGEGAQSARPPGGEEGGTPRAPRDDGGGDAGPTAKSLDTLDPAKGSFTAERDATLALARKGSLSGADRPDRIFPKGDPFLVISAIEVVHDVRVQNPADCANVPGGCRTSDDAAAHLAQLASLPTTTHDMLVKSLDAFDRWAMIAGAAEALGYANLLDQAGWLTPDMIKKIREAAITFTSLMSKPFATYDVRAGFVNAPS